MPLSRRRFLAGSASAALASVASSRIAIAAPRPADPDLWALLSDTHVSQNTSVAPNGQNISENLRHVVAYLTSLERPPAAVTINGDCAHNAGLDGDYRQFAQLLVPLAEAGLPVHLTLGNHDDRATFLRVLDHQRPGAVEDRCVTVVEGRRANWFLLDSLIRVNTPPGELGRAQLDWLSDQLDRRRDKPAIVMLHHNPRAGVPRSDWPFGLVDTDALLAVLSPRRHVKAIVHGHIHRFGLAEHEGMHIINTCAVGYVGKPQEDTTGWIMARLTDSGIDLTRYAIDPQHPNHGREYRLRWRA